ncbi:hypothetical protein LCGC14_2671510, partial [marine sediment metagenome]
YSGGAISTTGTFTLSSTQPVLDFNETDGPTDEKFWRWTASIGDLYLQTKTDALGVGANVLRITRTGTTVDLIRAVATTVDVVGTLTATTYVGQTSIVTLGTITSGTWNGTTIATANTAAKVVSVSGGVGIDSTGGENPSLTFDASELAVGGTLVAGDWLVAANASVSNRQLISSIPLSIFNNDSGWTSNAGTVTAVTGGTGIDSTGGTTPSITFDASELGLGGTLIASDHLVAANGGVSNRQVISSIPLSIFNNNLGWTTNVGDITGVNITAGTGLSGSVNTASGQHTQTLSVNASQTQITAVGTLAALNMGGNIDLNTNNIIAGGTASFTTITASLGVIQGATNSANVFSGGSTTILGANIVLYGESHLSQAHDIEFRNNTTVKMFWNNNISRFTVVGEVALMGVIRGTSTQSLVISGGSVQGLGGNIVMFGESHSTKAKDIG